MANPWGLLHYGIPSFKLDKDIARTRIAKLELIDVKFICNTRVGGDDIQVDGLREQYDAVFLGIGVPIGHKIKLPGEDLTGVNQATEFLVRSNLTLDDLPETLKRLPGIGKNVVAIDGSDISTDCVAQHGICKFSMVSQMARRGGVAAAEGFFKNPGPVPPPPPTDAGPRDRRSRNQDAD